MRLTLRKANILSPLKEKISDEEYENWEKWMDYLKDRRKDACGADSCVLVYGGHFGRLPRCQTDVASEPEVPEPEVPGRIDERCSLIA